MTWFRVGGAGVPVSLKNGMNAVFNKKFGTSGQNYPPNGWPDDVNLLGPLPEGTASGVVAKISDGADLVPIKSWNCSVNGNLTGVSSIQCTKSGDSVFFLSDIVQGSISVSGYNSESSARIRTDERKQVSPGAEYHIKCNSDVLIYEVHEYQDLLGSSTYTTINGSETTITTKSTTNYIRILFRYSNNAAITPAALTYLQCTKGTLSPYTNYAVSIGRTIYGGSADVVSGTVIDKYAKGSMTSSYLSGLTSSYIGYESSLAYFGGHPAIWVRNWNYQTAAARTAGGIGAVCNHFTISFNNSDIFASQYRVYFDLDGKNISSVADFIDYVEALEANNDSLDIVYELESSTEFTFEPISDVPETPLGGSGWWNNTGDSEVVYRRDIDLALQAVSSSRGLMMASRTVTQLVGEESDPDQVNELVEDDENDTRYQLNEVVENDETEQEGENDAR